MVVAIVVGRSGIDTLLVASQVVLSIVLPFVTFPLLYCTANKVIMSVRKSRRIDAISGGDDTLTAVELPPALRNRDAVEVENSGDAELEEMVDYSNNKVTIAAGIAIWLIVVAANVYVIVELARA
jgi:metal iron transporter